MTVVQRVTKNTGIVFTGNVIFRLVSLLINIYLARYLGTIGFGKYSFIFAYLAFFNIITDLGLQQILVKEMARNPTVAPKLIGNAYIIRLILTVVAVVSSVVVITLLSYPADTTTYVYIASLTLLCISFSDFYTTIFQANLRMEYNIIAKLISRGLSAVLIFWIIIAKGTLLHIMIALVFSETIKTLLNYSFSRKFVRTTFEIDLKLWKFLIKESLPLALYGVVWVIHFRTDIVMLSMMVGDAQAGIYSAAFRLSEPLKLIPSALLISLFPIMSAFFKTSKERLAKIYQLSIKYILIIMLPIAIGTSLIADKIILLIYGVEFAGSITALQILIWALLFTSINTILSNLLVSINQQKLIAVSITLGAILNVALNFILIPILSHNGAALATVITKAIIFGANFYFVSSNFQVIPLHRILSKPLFSGLMMGIFVFYFINLNIFLLISSSMVAYLAILLILGTFSDEDINIARKILYFFRS